MQEYTFNVTAPNGQNAQIKFNDVLFDYVACRKFLPENICLEIIDKIKEVSGKKVAIIFGNCQTQKIIEIFMHNAIFSEQYILLRLPPICHYDNEKSLAYVQEKFWSIVFE